MKGLVFLLFLVLLPVLASPGYGANPTADEAMSGELRMQELERQDQRLRQKIEQKETAVPEQEELPLPPQLESQEKVTLTEINVIGVTLVKEQEINAITAPYLNKEVTITELQKAADMITDAYRQKGYITSRAYLPPQKIEKGVLEIRVLEGMMGDMTLKGNRYFSTKLLSNMITIKKGHPFNYDTLRQDLVRINEQTDRLARAVLAPGKESGTTDLAIEVKDRLPIHVGFTADDFGSRYIDKQRYAVRLTHNNLLGLDDKLTFQYQLARDSRYFLKSIRYLLPIGLRTQFGIFAGFSRVKLGEELADLDVRGKSRVYGLFANYSLIKNDNLKIDLNCGFDYKNVWNYQMGELTSNDRLRVAKLGFESDLTDAFGRTVFTYEFDYGIPNIMGGLENKDIDASRLGAGGKFVKNSLNLLRLQKMPFGSALLWKNQMQLSPYTLAAAEQFQVGGIINVRGYPVAEAVGDSGYSMTWEWSFPLYFIPKNIKVPFSAAMLYDSLRIVGFYDWGNVQLKSPINTAEEKSKTLRSAGFGLRFNLPENFSTRLEFAWPLDSTPSDGDHLHILWQVSKEF